MSPAVVDRDRLTPGTVERLIAEAEAWLGTVEQPMGSNRVPGITDWYGLVGPWCAMAVSLWFYLAGLPLPASTAKGFAYTPSGAAWFKQRLRWTTTPRRGYVVFFDFPGDGVNRISHVGIVTGVNADGSINTIEGNTDERGGRTGGKVMRRVRSVGIVGYGIPDFATPTKEQIMASIPDACQQFAVLSNDDLVITTKQGHIYHFDADGVERGGDDPSYVDAYVNHPGLGGSVRTCLGVYAINRSRKAVPNGAPDAVGYCQVFDDGARYHWVR